MNVYVCRQAVSDALVIASANYTEIYDLNQHQGEQLINITEALQPLATVAGRNILHLQLREALSIIPTRVTFM